MSVTTCHYGNHDIHLDDGAVFVVGSIARCNCEMEWFVWNGSDFVPHELYEIHRRTVDHLFTDFLAGDVLTFNGENYQRTITVKPPE